MKLPQFFKRKKSVLLGVDISSSTVKVLELSELSDHRFQVECFAAEPLPPNSVIEKTIADVESVGEAIRRAVRKSGTKIRDAVVAVPGSSIISKTISMPASLNETELHTQIELEADHHIPYALEEVALDYEVLGTNPQKSDLVDIMLVACRSENVDARVAALELGGLEAKIVDVESFALENAFALISSQLPERGMNKLIGIVDIGSSMTTLYVLENHRLIYTREQVFGGQQLTEEIMRRYGLSYEEAGRAKKEGSLPDNYITDILEPFKEAVAQQVSRSLQYFYSSSRFNNVDHLIVAGGCTGIPDIDTKIEQRLNISTSVANPFSSMTVSSKVNIHNLRQEAAGLLVECGLALRSFE